MKNKYLKKLQAVLEKNRIANIDEIIAQYEKHFTEKNQEGLSDEEIIEKLGDAEEVAKKHGTEFSKKPIKNIGLFVLMSFFDFFIGVHVVFAVSIVFIAFFLLETIGIILVVGLPIVNKLENIDFVIQFSLSGILILIIQIVCLTIISILLCRFFILGLINYSKWRYQALTGKAANYKRITFKRSLKTIVITVAILLFSEIIYTNDIFDIERNVEVTTIEFEEIEEIMIIGEENVLDVNLVSYEGDKVKLESPLINGENIWEYEIYGRRILNIYGREKSRIDIFSFFYNFRNYDDSLTIYVPKDVYISEIQYGYGITTIDGVKIDTQDIAFGNGVLTLENVEFDALAIEYYNGGFEMRNSIGNSLELGFNKGNAAILNNQLTSMNIVYKAGNLEIDNVFGKLVTLQYNSGVATLEEVYADKIDVKYRNGLFEIVNREKGLVDLNVDEGNGVTKIDV